MYTINSSEIIAYYGEVNRDGSWIINFGLDSYPPNWTPSGYITPKYGIYRISYVLTNLRQNGTTGYATIKMYMRVNGGTPIVREALRSREPDPSEPDVLLLGDVQLDVGSKIEFGYSLVSVGSVGYDTIEILIEY